jgi:hypothetical protein
MGAKDELYNHDISALPLQKCEWCTYKQEKLF